MRYNEYTSLWMTLSGGTWSNRYCDSDGRCNRSTANFEVLSQSSQMQVFYKILYTLIYAMP